MVHAPYIMRRIGRLASETGFATPTVEPHGYLQTTAPEYLFTLLSRGLDAAVKAGECCDEIANGFIHEAERRVRAGTFYGAIVYISMIAEKPATDRRCRVA